jgi:Fe2+ or Zn2+ uptake regulation protein
VDASVDRSTVYRTLDLLKRQGLIDEFDLMHLNGEGHYYEPCALRTSKEEVAQSLCCCATRGAKTTQVGGSRIAPSHPFMSYRSNL